MLDFTHTARSFLQRLPGHTGSPEGGLRIARPPGETDGFRVVPARRPRRSDTLVEEDGARVFLGPVAAERLAGRTLDAREDEHGRVEFVVRAG